MPLSSQAREASDRADELAANEHEIQATLNSAFMTEDPNCQARARVSVPRAYDPGFSPSAGAPPPFFSRHPPVRTYLPPTAPPFSFFFVRIPGEHPGP